MNIFEYGLLLIFYSLGWPIYTGAYLLLIRKKEKNDLRDFDEYKKNGKITTLDMQGADADRFTLKISACAGIIGTVLMIVGSLVG